MESNSYTRVPICPLCRAASRKLIYDSLWLAPELGEGKETELSVFSCASCGLGYLDPRLSDEQLNYFYNGSPSLTSWYENVFPGTIPRISLWMKLYAHEFKSILPSGRVLDFGCGSGVFTNELRKLGFDVVAFDVGDVPKGIAKKHFDIDIVTDLATVGENFDGIALLDVIEHVADPIGLLRMLRQRLKPGGILHIATPNFASVARKLRGSKWKSIDRRGHLVYFDPRSIRLALKQSGYETIRVRTWGAISFLFPFAGGHALSTFATRSLGSSAD
jgi:SAM-dependent methyltransferase